MMRQLEAGFRGAGRPDLASMVTSPEFSIWIQQESGWNPRIVSERTNHEMVNGGLFQFWYGNAWSQPFFSRGNDPTGAFLLSPEEQAAAATQHFPGLTTERIRSFAQEIRNGTYHGWG